MAEFMNGGAIPQIQSSGDGVPIADTSEEVNVNPLALLKMLKHCRAGVPFEVMGLLLGEFVDPYTIKVSDVFATP